MTIEKLVAGQKGNVLNSTGSQVRDTVNALVDAVYGTYQNAGAVKIGGAVTTTATAINKTIAATFTLNARPTRVRFHFLNVSTSAVTGLKASVAPSENITVWSAPSGGVSAFQAIAVATTIPAATISTGNDSVVPAEVVSDWINPRAVPRTDGGSGFILMVRLYQDASSLGVKMNVGGANPTPAAEFGKYAVVTGQASTTGDFTTAAATFTEAGNTCPAFWMEVEYETPIATIAIVGDSIMQGSNSDPGNSSAAYGAAFQALQRINLSGKKCQLFNAGWSGSGTHSATNTQLGAVLAGYLGQFTSFVQSGAAPTVAAFCPWSVNNAGTYLAGQQDSVRQSIGVFMSLCNKNNIRPLLVTPAPRNGLNASDETQRRACVQIIKDYCHQYGVLLIDRDGVYTNYDVSTGGYKLPEWCVDNVHPTAVGHTAESVEWESKLNQIL